METYQIRSLHPILAVGFWFIIIGCTLIAINPLDKFARARDVVRQDLIFRLAVASEGCYAKNALVGGDYTYPHDCSSVTGLYEAGSIKDQTVLDDIGGQWDCGLGCISFRLERPEDSSLPYWKYDREGGRGKPSSTPCSGSCF